MNELREIIAICINQLGAKGYIANRYSGQPNTFHIENIDTNIAVNFSYDVPSGKYSQDDESKKISEICREALEESGYEITLYSDSGIFSAETENGDIYIYMGEE